MSQATRAVRQAKAAAAARAAQGLAAEVAALQAKVRMQAAEAERAGALMQLTDRQEGWSSALSQGLFSPLSAMAWAAEVARADGLLREADRRLDESRTTRDLQLRAWNAARARLEAAEALVRTRRRRLGRLREEAALEEIADRVARRTMT